MSDAMEDLVNELASCRRHGFKEWPNPSIPSVCAGVYTIYDRSGRFLYVGMAGASLSPARIEKLEAIPGRRSGLFDRLASHASGYRSGDRFNINICDLYVLKKLSNEQIEAISTKSLSLDTLNKNFIRAELSYRYLVTPYSVVRELEDFIQRKGIDGTQPSINPKSSTPTGEA